MHAHDRVVDDASKAVYKVVNGKLETDAPVEQYTTQGGKVLDGMGQGSRHGLVGGYPHLPPGRQAWLVYPHA
jgi:hypothetical protein